MRERGHEARSMPLDVRLALRSWQLKLHPVSNSGPVEHERVEMRTGDEFATQNVLAIRPVTIDSDEAYVWNDLHPLAMGLRLALSGSLIGSIEVFLDPMRANLRWFASEAINNHKERRNAS